MASFKNPRGQLFCCFEAYKVKNKYNDNHPPPTPRMGHYSKHILHLKTLDIWGTFILTQKMFPFFKHWMAIPIETDLQ